MKIKNGNNQTVRAEQKKADEKARKKADRKAGEKDFRALLDGKKGEDGKSPIKEEEGSRKLGADATTSGGDETRLGKDASATQSGDPEGARLLRDEAAGKHFSKELNSDRTQLAQKDAAIDQQRRQDVKAQIESGARIASDGTRDDQPIKQAADAIQAVDGAPQQPAAVNEANAKAPAQPAKAQELQELISKMVQKVQVGEDARQRKTVILQVDIPDRGQVNIRLRKDGDGYDLRLRAKDPSFAHALKSEQGELRRMASEKGLRFTRVDVVQ